MSAKNSLQKICEISHLKVFQKNIFFFRVPEHKNIANLEVKMQLERKKRNNNINFERCTIVEG